MNLVFSGSNSTEIEFKVGVAGTAVAPQRVMAVLEQDGMSLSFAAREQEGCWRAIVSNVGQVFKAGLANFSINVILNDKLFIPMKNQVTIETESLVSVEMTPPPIAVPSTDTNVAPLIVPQATRTAEALVPQTTEVKKQIKEEPTPKVAEIVPTVAEVATPVVQKFSLLRSIEPTRKRVSETKKVVQKPVVESAPAVTSFTLRRVKVVTE